uniref:Small ribosomal subunit protein uS3c n=1 Tax=Verdigellas peltata TaxID=542676 RepID=A0A161KBS3_9VIRI|nr:ribosomal protein S3 [Verdigellas peltata]CZF96631.1 ribosomal protein S3 [Verdigellas peltata]
MGQKIHPVGFRLGITQSHQSNWFASPKTYSSYVYEDFVIRNYLTNSLKPAGLAKILINRQIDELKNNQLEIHILINKLEFLLMESDNFHKFRNKLEVFLKKKFPHYATRKQFLRLVINQIENPEFEAALIAADVVEKLENRILFRKALRQAIEKTKKNSEIEGLKIQVSGRLNGAEMARTEWLREGRVPLQTLRAKIDYSHCEANTLYGVIGVKVWVFKLT